MSLAARFDTKSFSEAAVVAEDTPSQQELPETTGDINLCTLERSELSRRNPTPIIRSFAAAIDQNQTLGTPLAAVLKKQAETTRRHRRQAAETRAAAVSMKMIFPTVFCILPLLMIVVVGPAIVRLMEVL